MGGVGLVTELGAEVLEVSNLTILGGAFTL